MRASEQCIAFIKSYEECSLSVYPDPAGRPTIGWGHLICAQEDFSEGITQEAADELFLKDLQRKAVNPVAGSVDVSLTEQEADACISLCFNIGAGHFESSSLLQLINTPGGAEDTDAVRADFEKWDKITDASGNHVVSAGLLDRRRAEAEIFINGNYINHN